MVKHSAEPFVPELLRGVFNELDPPGQGGVLRDLDPRRVDGCSTGQQMERSNRPPC